MFLHRHDSFALALRVNLKNQLRPDRSPVGSSPHSSLKYRVVKIEEFIQREGMILGEITLETPLESSPASSGETGIESGNGRS